MAKIAVVYWSGTGHTEAMAEAVARGCGGELFTASAFAPEMVSAYDAIAFGCQLEEGEFEPMFTECEAKLKGKKIALFGSYGWGDGEWMRTWEAECQAAGAELACDSVICQDEPDGDALTQCEALGHALK